MIGIIEYFEEKSQDTNLDKEAGRLYWTAVPFIFCRQDGKVPRLRVDYIDEKKPHNSRYTLEMTDITHFRPEDEKPIYELGLPSD